MPKEFEWPAFVGPTSSVIKKPSDWTDTGILVPHEAIRWYNKNVLEILDVFDPIGQPDTDWKIPVFFDWFDNYYYECIHHHHNAEEEIYNPGIEAKLGRPIEGNIKADHADLLQQLDKLKAFRSRLRSGDAKDVEEFKSFFKDFISVMETHLAQEEEVYPEALKESGMTEAEEGEIIQQIIQGLGLAGNKKFLPPIMYAMCMWRGEQEAFGGFFSSIPPPIQFLFTNCWVADFYENQLQVLDALKASAQFTPKAPVCSICSVM